MTELNKYHEFMTGLENCIDVIEENVKTIQKNIYKLLLQHKAQREDK